MFIVISIMFAGIAVGYLLKRVPLLHKLGRPITYPIYALLFTLGVQALLLSVAATLGSVIMAWIVYRFLLHKGGRTI